MQDIFSRIVDAETEGGKPALSAAELVHMTALLGGRLGRAAPVKHTHTCTALHIAKLHTLHI